MGFNSGLKGLNAYCLEGKNISGFRKVWEFKRSRETSSLLVFIASLTTTIMTTKEKEKILKKLSYIAA